MKTRLQFQPIAALRAWVVHLRHYWLAHLCLVLVLLSAFYFIRIGFNSSHSVDGTMFIIVKGWRPTRGQTVAFEWTRQDFPGRGKILLKRVAGVEGDEVQWRQDGALYVAGAHIGRGGEAMSGEPLAPISSGAVPPGTFFAAGTSLGSYDSRYRRFGYVATKNIIGRAFKVY